MLRVYIFSNGDTILCYYRAQSLWKWTEKVNLKKKKAFPRIKFNYIKNKTSHYTQDKQ